MKVTPKTEKEISMCYEPGVYDFEITKALEKTSKSGNEMIEITLRVYDGQAGSRFITDYLISIDSMAYKLRHCAECCGLLSDYENGTLEAESFLGKGGKVKIKIQEDKTGQYADKNVVVDYVVDKEKKIDAKIDEDLDDTAPF